MSLDGKLGYQEISDLLNLVEKSSKSGILTISNDRNSACMFFNRGKLVRASSDKISDRIGEVLLNHGVISQEEIEQALEIQKNEERRRRLGTIFSVELGVEDAAIQSALTTQFKAIVFEVLSWEEGRFNFEFGEPSDTLDKFNFGSSGFILEVGIEAGFTSRLENHSGNSSFIFIDTRKDFVDVCIEFCKEQSIAARCILTMTELKSVVQADDNHKILILSSNLGPDARQVAKAVRKTFPDMPIIAYGSDNAVWKEGGLAEFAQGFVKAPTAEDLKGPDGYDHLESFISMLQGAISSTDS